MDTRSKIVGPEAALRIAQRGRTAIVRGYFDPLLIEHVRRIREIRQPCDTLIVVLSNPSDPILSAEARAELVAALEAVDYVVLPVGVEWPGEFFLEEAPHRRRFEQLIEYVHRRHALTISGD